MRRRHQRRMYPPRVKMTVSLKNPDLTLKLPVKFTGCLSDSQLDVELTFPLGKNNVIVHCIASFPSVSW